MPSLRQLERARPRQLLGREMGAGELDARAAEHEAAPQHAAQGQSIGLPAALHDRIGGAGVGEPGLGRADEQVGVLTAAMGEFGPERAGFPSQALEQPPRRQQVVGARPGGQAVAVAILRPRRPEIAGTVQPCRQLQFARQPPEPEHEVGFGLALSAHEAIEPVRLGTSSSSRKATKSAPRAIASATARLRANEMPCRAFLDEMHARSAASPLPARTRCGPVRPAGCRRR